MMTSHWLNCFLLWYFMACLMLKTVNKIEWYCPFWKFGSLFLVTKYVANKAGEICMTTDHSGIPLQWFLVSLIFFNISDYFSDCNDSPWPHCFHFLLHSLNCLHIHHAPAIVSVCLVFIIINFQCLWRSISHFVRAIAIVIVSSSEFVTGPTTVVKSKCIFHGQI